MQLLLSGWPVRALEVPKGHSEQPTAVLVAPSIVPKVPLGQTVHEDEPGVTLYVPDGHSMEAVMPPVPQKVPAGARVQAETGPTLYAPAGQGVGEADSKGQ